MRQIRIITVFLLTWVIFSGCAQNIYFFSGTESDPFKLASLQIEKWQGGLDIEIDGKAVGWDRSGDYPVYVRIRPGGHTVKWSLMLTDTAHVAETSGPDRELTVRDVKVSRTYRGEGILDAKAGKFYHFEFRYLEGKKREVGSPYDRYIREFIIEVKDTATWIEELCISFTPCVAVGTIPEWMEWHTCEICGKKAAAAPGKYGCSECRLEKFKQYD